MKNFIQQLTDKIKDQVEYILTDWGDNIENLGHVKAGAASNLDTALPEILKGARRPLEPNIRTLDFDMTDEVQVMAFLIARDLTTDWDPEEVEGLYYDFNCTFAGEGLKEGKQRILNRYLQS